ncbi:MAG: hypothetical protein ACXVNM_01255 [Bacteroidia bacterium]
MLRKDLLMRQFEEFGKVLALILGYKKQNDFEKFEKEMEEAVKKFTPFELQTIECLSINDFDKEVLNNKSLLPEQFKILGDLLFEKMKYYAEQGEEEKVEGLKEKCILLFRKFSENLTHNEFNLDVHYKLEFLSRMK